MADICATNDTLWNDWKGTLLNELYFATQKALRLGLENPPDLRLRIRENQRHALQWLQAQGVEEFAILPVWQQFKADYFLRHTPEQIAWHTRHILQHGSRERPLVLFGQHKTRGGSELFIYCKDMPNRITSYNVCYTKLLRQFDVAVGFSQGLFAVHHAGAGALAQFLNHSGGNV